MLSRHGDQLIPAGGGKLLRCPFPNCQEKFVKPVEGPEACPKHRQFILDLAFIIPKMTIVPIDPPAPPTKKEG